MRSRKGTRRRRKQGRQRVPGGQPSAEDLAERQDGLLSVAQAHRCGISSRQIWRRRANGRYRRTRRGVVQIAGVPPTWRQAVRAATIAAGEQVVVSHASAAQLYGVELPTPIHPRWSRDGAFIELSAPLARHARLEGVRGHRSGMWAAGDVITRAGIPVTSPLRLVIDLSSRLGVEGTGRLVDELLRRGLLKLNALRRRVQELRPAPGRSVRVLRIVVAVRADRFEPGDSTLESRLRQVIARRGFPRPVGQHWVRDKGFKVRLDFAYPDVKVYLEGDSFGFHRFASDLDHDARKRNGLTVRGWRGLHFTWRMTDAEIEQQLERFYDRKTRRWRVPD